MASISMFEGEIESVWIELYPSTKRSVLFVVFIDLHHSKTFLITFYLNVNQLILIVLNLFY